MFLARVEGSVVATKKEASMSGRKLLLLRPQLVDEKDPTTGKKKFIVNPGLATTWIAVSSLFMSWYAGRYIYRMLALRLQNPSEVEALLTAEQYLAHPEVAGEA